MRLLDSEQGALRCAQQFVLINQLKPRVKIILVEKLDRGFSRVAIQVVNRGTIVNMIPSPNKCRRPIATIDWPIVLNGSRRSLDINVWLLIFRALQKAITYLHRPIPVGRETQTH